MPKQHRDDSDRAERLEFAVKSVLNKLSKPPVENWRNLTEHKLLYELVACILGSGVRFEHAQSAAAHLWHSGLLQGKLGELKEPAYERKFASELNKPIYLPLKKNGEGRRYRYPNLRARCISKTTQLLYQENSNIKDILSRDSNIFKVRNILISKTSGIGPKQASLFLRNIGYAEDLAVLDVHVMRYMFYMGLLSEGLNKIFNMSSYENVEERLKKYAYKLDTKLSMLDTAIWVVMRVYQMELVA